MTGDVFVTGVTVEVLCIGQVGQLKCCVLGQLRCCM